MSFKCDYHTQHLITDPGYDMLRRIFLHSGTFISLLKQILSHWKKFFFNFRKSPHFWSVRNNGLLKKTLPTSVSKIYIFIFCKCKIYIHFKVKSQAVAFILWKISFGKSHVYKNYMFITGHIFKIMLMPSEKRPRV